jgi:lauroyl/myristoyl acyltransferase
MRVDSCPPVANSSAELAREPVAVPTAPVSRLPAWLRHFDARGIIWRHYLDWAVSNLPFYFLPMLMFFWTFFFFFFAAGPRRGVVANLRFVLPGSSRLMNHLRALRTIYQFAWAITDATAFKFNLGTFDYEIVGEEFLDELAAAEGAIVLTAHMGNYDLGAALFAQKFSRDLRMVRAPEPHRESELHLNDALQQTGAGAVKVDYSTSNTLLSFDLLNSLRSGEIVSIQGDRVVGEVSSRTARLFNHDVRLPDGPFILAQVAEVPIYPLFIVRRGYKRYRVIVREPILAERTERSREAVVATAMQQWCAALEQQIAEYWDQWAAFVPIFAK